MRQFACFIVAFACAVPVVADDVVYVYQPVVCASTSGAARTSAPVMPVGKKTDGSVGAYLGNVIAGWSASVVTEVDKVDAFPLVPKFDRASGKVVLPDMEGNVVVTFCGVDGRQLYRRSGRCPAAVTVEPEWPHLLLVGVESAPGAQWFKVVVK